MEVAISYTYNILKKLSLYVTDGRYKIDDNMVENSIRLAAAKQAYQATYGYEWQGDNLLLARENALYTFFDYYQDKFHGQPTKEQACEIAEIISWNFWQMDGLKGVIPNSCHDDVHIEPSLFGDGEEVRIPCKGCETDDILATGGTAAAAVSLVRKFSPAAVYLNFIIDITDIPRTAGFPAGVQVDSLLSLSEN